MDKEKTNTKEFEKGRLNFAEEVLAVFRQRKVDDITKYVIIVNKAKQLSTSKVKE